MGIDLGTTRTKAAIWRRHQPEMIPCPYGNPYNPDCHYIDSYFADTSRGPLFGSEAKNSLNDEPSHVFFDSKRMIGLPWDHPDVQRDRAFWPFTIVEDRGFPAYSNPTTGKRYSPTEVSSLVLTEMKQIIENKLNAKIDDVVITCPAYFGDSQRNETKKAAMAAGFQNVSLINEPTAASLAYGNLKPDSVQNILVFDYGGGTCDVSIVNITPEQYTVVALAGNNHCGGQDIDNLLADMIAQDFKKQKGIDITTNPIAFSNLKQECEKAKILLSNKQHPLQQVRICLQLGIDISNRLCFDLSREQFNQTCKAEFEKCMDCVKLAMNLPETPLKASDISKVLLVGGSSNILHVQEMLANEMGFGRSKLSRSQPTRQWPREQRYLQPSKPVESLRHSPLA